MGCRTRCSTPKGPASREAGPFVLPRNSADVAGEGFEPPKAVPSDLVGEGAVGLDDLVDEVLVTDMSMSGGWSAF